VGGIPTTLLNGSSNAGLALRGMVMAGRLRSNPNSWIVLDDSQTGWITAGSINGGYFSFFGDLGNRVQSDGTQVFRLQSGTQDLASCRVIHGGMEHSNNPGNGWFQDIDAKIRGASPGPTGGSGQTLECYTLVDCIAIGWVGWLVKWEPAGVDDLHLARYMFHVAGDAYEPNPCPGDNGGQPRADPLFDCNNPSGGRAQLYAGIQSARLVRLTTTPQFIGAVTIREAITEFDGGNTLNHITKASLLAGARPPGWAA
jgi:hypothetical protein